MTAMDNVQHHLHVGDRVRVMDDNPKGNPRTPEYIRGKSGVVTLVHGAIPNPVDHRDIYPPLCTVLFTVRDVFGGSGPRTLPGDLHEDALGRARGSAPA